MEEENVVEKTEEVPNAEEQDHSAVFEEGIETEEAEKVETAEKANEGENSEEEKEKPVSEATKEEKNEYAFRKKQFELKEERQKRQQLEVEKQELQAKIDAQAVTTRPTIPDVPDSYDTEFEQKMAIRDEAIKLQQAFDQKAKTHEQMQAQNHERIVEDRKRQVLKNQEDFSQRANDLGIDKEKLLQSEKYITSFATPQNLPTIEFVQTHKDGPLIVQYLSQNYDVLDKVANMHPMQAAEFIATEVAPKAIGLKPKTPSAPHPVQTFDSKGAKTPEPKALEGAKFE